jgi:hypothetical protein
MKIVCISLPEFDPVMKAVTRGKAAFSWRFFASSKLSK